jgi:AAA family ATP:ADP antiporter
MSAAVQPLHRADEKSWLDRGLSLFTDVRAGEGLTALLLATNLFCLLGLYYVLKPVRDALILSESGAVAQSYAAAGQALLLLVLVPAYGAIASRLTRVRLIGIVTLFFASNLVVFYLLGIAGLRFGVAFYVWLGIFNLMVPAQLWAFANDLFSNERGKRLFPLVGLGASLGAWIGAEAASQMFADLGPYRLMLVAATALVACLFLTVWVDRRERAANGEAGPMRAVAEQPLGKEGGFQLVLAQRYLLYIALLMVVLNTVNTLGGFLLSSLVEVEAARAVQTGAAGSLGTAEWIGGFMGSFYANVNLLGFLIQMFLVSRIFKYIGVRGALFVLPLVALASYSSLAFFPVLSIVRLAKTLENSTDYSIQNTARHALFLPTSREAKYKAKQAIDSFFWRAGDLLQAVVVFVGVRLALGIRGYAAINLVFVAIWLVLVVAIAREHKKLVPVDVGEKAAA